MKNFESVAKCSSLPGFDPASIEEKIKNLKFAKLNSNPNKDADWFSKLNTVAKSE